MEFNPIGSRSVSKEMGFNSPYDVDKEGRRMEFQIELQMRKVAWEQARSQFVTDRTTLDELVYCIMHCPEEVTEGYLTSAVLHMKRYTVVVWCPASSFISTEVDEHRKQNSIYQLLFDMTLGGALRQVGPSSVPVVRLEVSDLEARKGVLRERLRLL